MLEDTIHMIEVIKENMIEVITNQDKELQILTMINLTEQLIELQETKELNKLQEDRDMLKKKHFFDYKTDLSLS